MRCFPWRTLALAFGVAVGNASAEEPVWRAASLGKPTPLAPSSAIPATAPVPHPTAAPRPAAVRLGLPTVAVTPRHDPAVQPASAAIYRAQAPEPLSGSGTDSSLPLNPPRAMPKPAVTESRNGNGSSSGNVSGSIVAGEGPRLMAPTMIPSLWGDSDHPLGCEEPLHCAGITDAEYLGGCRDRWFVHGEYLMWYMSRMSLPPLITTNGLSTAPNLAQRTSLDEPGTVVLFGGEKVLPNQGSGFRIRMGHFWGDDCIWGWDGSIFVMGTRATSTTLGTFSPGVLNGTLGRPYISYTGMGGGPKEISEIISSPDLARGGISVLAYSNLWGADINLRRNVWQTCSGRGDFFTGFRFLGLSEGVEIHETIVGVGPATGFSAMLAESFKTQTQFYGPQIGWVGERTLGRWSLNLRASIALGVNSQNVQIRGATGFNGLGPGGPGMNPVGDGIALGGLYAQNSNIGDYSRNRFAVVPEIGVTLGYNLTERLRLTIGYNMLYWTNVLRAGDQIDRMVDEARIPNFYYPNPNPLPAAGNRPGVLYKESDFWARGMNFGLQWVW